ncbi:hypothetical protein IV494_08400 [Kaistella sp. G5-32]|uniref:Uncharacterized protein n=1 Tax=Kaistella gelatinilytica TaxID=2787636 RepID=A0ABS0FC18_9FLAO|nr:hypothetical protein [Kaistella gelatinilytica]MBF8457202.1 hypothetical protein [Kaistella gelatinilytica]
MDGVFPWQIARISIFLHIVDQLIPGSTAPINKSKKKQLKDLLHRLFINVLFFNPFLDFKHKKVLVIESGRKYRDEGSYIDIYTEYLCQQLDKDHVTYTRYENNYNIDDALIKRKLNIKHLDFILLFSKLKTKFIKSSWSEIDVQKIQEITHALEFEFGLKIDLPQIFDDEIRRFKAEVNLYSKLFRLKKAEEIYITNSSEKASVIEAAKNNGMLVKELQHGLMSDKDVISNYPYTNSGSLRYFPDQFYIWDNVDMFFSKLPLEEKNIIPFRNRHIERYVQKTANILKEEKTILVISQPYGSAEIQEFIKSNHIILSEYSIIYKMHPSENEQLFSTFKNEFSEVPNIRFVNNEESMYVLLKKAKYALGIYSSSLFEAKAFDCKVILLNLPGVEMSFPLLRNRENKLIDINRKVSDILI